MTTSNSPQKLSKTKSHPFWRWFWLTFLVLSLSYAWYSFYVPSSDIKWASNIASAQNIAKDSGKNTLIFFTGKWCVPCRIMKRQIFTDKAAMTVINSKVVPLLINIDDPNTIDLVKQYKVSATPTTIIIDAQGEILEHAVGKVEKKEFLKMLNNSASQ